MVMMYVTVSDNNIALIIAETILKERLTNHVNIIKANHCKIWKDDKIVDSVETLLLIKTKAMLYSHIERKINAMNLKDEPKIFSVPITQIDHDYFDFLKKDVMKV
jgi:uncharacterized protein involved in tolerance to divalent cations